jgi:hypothetical protein
VRFDSNGIITPNAVTVIEQSLSYAVGVPPLGRDGLSFPIGTSGRTSICIPVPVLVSCLSLSHTHEIESPCLTSASTATLEFYFQSSLRSCIHIDGLPFRLERVDPFSLGTPRSSIYTYVQISTPGEKDGLRHNAG